MQKEGCSCNFILLQEMKNSNLFDKKRLRHNSTRRKLTWMNCRRRLCLDINISTKYVYVTKHAHTRMKKPRKSCFCECKWKSGCASVAWNMSFYHNDKNFRLCKCRTLKTSCRNVVKFRLCECRTLKSSCANVVKFRLCECNV